MSAAFNESAEHDRVENPLGIRYGARTERPHGLNRPAMRGVKSRGPSPLSAPDRKSGAGPSTGGSFDFSTDGQGFLRNQITEPA